jgi:outer membrane protein assembly factor BamE (lipoprotein component of BamABCDE complex)
LLGGLLPSAGCLITGARYLVRGPVRQRRVGWALLLASLLLPASCWVVPSLVFRLTHGTGPIGDLPYRTVREGMTPEQVIAILGPPHDRHSGDDGEHWYYSKDSFGIDWFKVEFDPQARVRTTWSN